MEPAHHVLPPRIRRSCFRDFSVELRKGVFSADIDSATFQLFSEWSRSSGHDNRRGNKTLAESGRIERLRRNSVSLEEV